MTKLVDVGSVGAYFESLSDPRHPGNRKHLLTDIIIAVCGIICGCDGPTAIHRWASRNAELLKQHLPLPNGIPSRDCIRRLLMVLKPAAFQQCFQEWIADALPPDADSGRKLVGIDGRTCRGSHDAAKGRRRFPPVFVGLWHFDRENIGNGRDYERRFPTDGLRNPRRIIGSPDDHYDQMF